MPLRDLPKSKFPFRIEKHARIDAELEDAASRFSQLGYEDLAREMDAVRARLNTAWQAIRTAEISGR